MRLISSAIAVVAAILLLYTFGVFDPPIVTACETNLKRYLFAPSSYTRNRFVLGERPVTRTDIEERYENFPDLKSFNLKKFESGTMEAVLYTATLNFTALNEKAELVTTTVICPYLSLDGGIAKLAVWDAIPRPTNVPAYLQIIRDLGNDPLPTKEKIAENTKPIAPYTGWLRYTFRRLLN